MESLTRPLFHHRRKVSNACSSSSSNSNGLSFSGKDAYDDVFAGVPKPKFGAASSFVASSRKVAAQDYAEIFCGKNGTRGSSIPVLDLSDLEERNGSDDFRSSNGKVDYSMIFGGSGVVGDDGATAVPPFEEIFNGAKRGKTDKAKARIPADLGSPVKGSDRFNSSENKKDHSSEASDQLFDGGKQFNMSYHKISERVKDGSNGTTHIAQLHAVPGFTNVIDETAHLQTEQIKATPPVKTKVNHSRSTSDHLQRREQVKAIPPVKSEVNHTRSSIDRLQKTEQDKAIPTVKAEVNENRNSSDCPQKTEQDMAIPPVKVEVNHNRSSSDDTSDGKSGRRAKWQLPTMQASKGLVTDNRECNEDASCSMEFKLYNVNELDMKSHPSKVPPPFGSSANLISSKGHPKRSKSSNVSPKVEASEKVAGGYSTPFSDEDLDVNSAAAASAAALKKAIEQAQESIRIAKEIMERKRDSVQSSKSRSMGSLKAKDRREIRYVEEADNIRENNVKEASESVAKEVQDFIGIDQKVSFGDGDVASTFEKREKPSTGRQAEVEMNGENIEVADDNGVAMWFTQLLNNGKHRMAALASELVGKKNSILQPVDKDIHDTEETKPAKVTFGWDTTEQVNPFDRIFEFGHIETKLNAPERAEELEKDVDNPDSSQFAHDKNVSETLMFVQENEVTNNTHQGSDKEENSKENLEYTHEIVSDRRVELKKSGDVLPENELLKLEEKSFGQEAEKILEDFHVWEENDCRVDEEEIDKQQEERHTCVGIDDEPKFAAGCVSNGKQQEDDPEERLEGYHKQTTYEPRLTQSVDGEENQIMSEEEHVWEEIDRRPAGTYQKEEADMKDEYAVNSSANEKIEVNEKIQELCNTRAATEEIAEIPLENLFQEAVYRESLNTAFGADNIDQSANVGDIQEAARCEVESGNEQTSELDTRNHEEKGNLAGFTEQTSQQEGRNNEKARIDVSESFYEFEGDAKAQQAVEEASRLKGKQITETSFLDHADAQENTMETDIQDVSEAVACDDKTSFGFIDINHEAGLSNDTQMAETTGFIHHGAKDDAMYNEDATEAPSAVKSSSNFNFTVINGHKQIHENNIEFESSINIGIDSRFVHEVYGQKQVEENDRESESADEPDYGDGLVHDSGGNAENVKVNGIASDKGIENDNIEICDKEIECISTEKELESSQFARELKQEEHVETNTEMKTGQVTRDNEENVCKTSVKEEKETAETVQKEEAGKDYLKRTEVNKREREREKDRIAVERAIREARERAFAEARERAERAAVEKATAEVRQRAMTEAREKLEKVSASTKVPTDKASIEAKLRAERAAVERATAEARERALEKALSQKTTSGTRMQAERNGSGKVSGASRDTGLKHSFPSSDLERCDGTNNESTQRRKARLERHHRIMERASKALAEKNLRDVLAQREQAERNRLAETLDADIKRWASGKEGNLRALLSTLQYILGPGSGWQPISLTEIITTDGVKKAYRKATLYVHPDKLQQRGASIQQKYICEKVFDLLKAAWNRFNSAER